VLNNCRPDSALPRAEEIRKAICVRPVHTDAGPLSVSMSLGVLLSQDWGQRPPEELINEVDAALYSAKAEGRNRVKLAKPAERPEPVTAAQALAERLR
jgi:diguanylate cyclase (GGDEF)-like protein